MLIWVFGAVISYCGGFSYTEWGLMIPESGGDTPYLEYTYKRPKQMMSFLYCWCRVLLAHTGYTAALCIIVGNYFFVVFPLDPNGLGRYAGWLGKVIALMALVSIWAICAFSTEIATKATSVITMTKILTVVFVVISGIVFAAGGFPSIPSSGNFSNAFQGSTTEPGKIAGALFKVFFCYDGWAYLGSAIGELENPKRNVPRSIVGGVTIVATLYILANFSYLLVLPKEQLINSKERLGAEFAIRLYGPLFGKFMSLLIMLSAYGSGLAISFAASRVATEAAKRGFLPKSERIAQIHPKYETPFNAVTFHSFLSLVMIVAPPPGPAFFFLVDLCGYGVWIFYGVTLVGLLVLRKREPLKERPFRVFLACPIMVILTSIFLSVFPFLDPDLRAPAGLGLLVLLLGIPAWYYQIGRRASEKEL